MINREALDFVRGAKGDPRPFFLTVAHIAPHATSQTARGPCGVGGLPLPERGALGQWKSEPLPRPPSFNERRIGDKPDWVSQHPPFGPKRIRALKWGWRCALASLATVDRGVGNLIDRLAAQGELRRTAIFFTSDNGYLFGQHRVFLNKVYPYEESIRVPLLARLPDARRQPGAGRRAGQQPRPHRDDPRPRPRHALHRERRMPHPRRALAAAAAARPPPGLGPRPRRC